VLLLALVGVLSVTRGTPVEYVIADGDRGGPPKVGDPLFMPTMELFTNTELEVGNRVELLLNGDGTYPPLWRDLRSAARTITVQMYFAKPGAVADTMAAILAERARAGCASSSCSTASARRRCPTTTTTGSGRRAWTCAGCAR
jgi:cardiolipin synthase